MNSNRRHAQKTTPYREKVLTLQKPVPTLKKKSEYQCHINFTKSHQIS